MADIIVNDIGIYIVVLKINIPPEAVRWNIEYILQNIILQYTTNMGNSITTDTMTHQDDLYVRRELCIDVYAGLYSGTTKFDLSNYPYPCNFDFIAYEKTKLMLSSAYNTISRLGKWKVMYEYTVDKDMGFVFTHYDKIALLMDEIRKDYEGFYTDLSGSLLNKHTDFTIGYTMSNMEYLAKNGMEELKKIHVRK